MKLLIAGDFCPFGKMQELFRKKEFGAVFSDVIEVFNNVDYSIINLETPILKNGTIAQSISKCGPALKTDESCIDALKYLKVSCVALANNHFRDYGDRGCYDTIELLKNSSISYVGGGRSIVEANEILSINHKGLVVSIINCCEHEFSIASAHTAGSNPLDPVSLSYQIKQAKELSDYVLVIVHGGLEYLQYPSVRMKKTYRFFIDSGADIVINHHQHCYSGYEEYKNKPIFYGLGNFGFDWQGRPSCWYEGFFVQLSLESRIGFSVIPYFQCYNGLHSIERMKGDDLNSFHKSLSEINKGILNDEYLDTVNKQFLEDNISKYQLSFEPYSSRLTKKLYRMGLLPSFINKNKKMQLLNYIECESHLPGVINYLKRV